MYISVHESVFWLLEIHWSVVRNVLIDQTTLQDDDNVFCCLEVVSMKRLNEKEETHSAAAAAEKEPEIMVF